MMVQGRRYKVSGLISIFFLCFLFTACSDNNGAGQNSQIMGTWQMTEITAGNRQVSAEEYQKAASVTRPPVLTFEESGAVTLDMDGESGTGTWTQEGADYSITYKRGDKEKTVPLELNGSQLTMDQDGYTLTYEKR